MTDTGAGRRDGGFSLVEVLIVVLIVVVLAAIGFAVTLSAQQGVADARAKANVTAAVDAIGRFAFANDGALPTTEQFLDGTVEFVNVASSEPGHVRYSLDEDSARFCVAAAGDGGVVFVADNRLAATPGSCVDGIARAAIATPAPSPTGDLIDDL